MAPSRQQKQKTNPKPKPKHKTKRTPHPAALQDAEDSGAGYHTTPYQIDAMVQWLEIPANYNIIAGNSTKGKKMAHGEGTTKISGFKSMAEFVHTATVKHMSEEGFFDPTIAAEWEPKQCQSRWNSIFRRYRAARFKLDNQTGFGLTQEMVAEGKTVEDLAEESCPCFGRIDELFGGNSNVTPPSEMSGPIYNDADWLPISDGWTANRNTSADKGEQDEVDAGSSQSDVASQINEEHENIDPNI